jgi:FkbM family methyltransferase
VLFKREKIFTIIDVGAHIGIYTLKAAKNVGKRGRVIAIEPENRNLELLVKN